MRRITFILSILTVSLVAVTSLPSASAKRVQDDALFTVLLDDMPPAPTPSALARITFAPGSGLSMTANPGPALHYVEEGSFDVTMLGAGAIERAGTTPLGQATPVTTGERFTFAPGDLLVIPANTPFEVYNNGSAPSEALIIEFFTRDLTAPLPDGIVLDLLVAGEAASLNSRQAIVSLARVTMEPETHMMPGLTKGVDLIYVEDGAASYSLASAEATPVVDNLTFSAGSTVIAQLGSEGMIQSIGDEPLSLLMLTII